MLSLQDIRFVSNDHQDYTRRLERAYEQLQTSLETAKNDHKRIREMRKWDDYDKLYKKYLKKCGQLKQYQEVSDEL